ncbi:MAG: RluA family pseudouridine synthase [Candidatus Omnitrophota bacterium]
MSSYLLEVDEKNNDLRLDVFLAKNLADIPSRNFAQKLIDEQKVTVNGRVVKAHEKVLCGDRINVDAELSFRDNVEPENIALDIFYEDEGILVVNKDPGMLVHPAAGRNSGTLVNAILYHCKTLSDVNSSFRPGIVHRLDEATSGLIVVAKNNIAHTRLAEQFEKHTVKKQYLALVEGLVEFDEGLIDASLGRHPRQREKQSVLAYDAREAKTVYRVLRRSQRNSLVALFPETGRTHQLRVHMAHLGHPILGDEKYGKKSSFHRLALHAQSLGFLHPVSLAYLEFTTQFPADFKEMP